MPVTFKIVDQPSRPYKGASPCADPGEFLCRLPTTRIPEKVLQSSLDGTQNVVPRKNGFLYGAIEAYNGHHHLIIRPDDVWIAILSQLNFYINAHAEELRDKFVSHQDKKTLVVETLDSIDKANFGDLATQMGGQISNNVKDQSLVPWVLPNFSTTTANDTVICSVLLMSSFKEYFRYLMKLGCGLPSITLEGSRSDWHSILNRIDKIPEFGEEPKEWAAMLRVILRRFVRAFDEGGPPQSDMAFWGKMINRVGPRGSRVAYISGWMGAFAAWDKRGEFFGARRYLARLAKEEPELFEGEDLDLVFDGVSFPRVNVYPPEGYAEVDVLVQDLVSNQTMKCTMLAGHVGMAIDGKDQDTIRIAPQWFMYVKGQTPARVCWES